MIEKFRSSFTDELARPSRFKVNVNVPQKLRTVLDSETLSMRCENASLPGRNISTSDLRIYGPTEKFPYQSSYEDITLTFIVSGSMIEKALFNTWMDYINPTQHWNFDYKANYVTDVIITQYDVAGNESHVVKLLDAFPVAVNQLDLDWSNDNAYHKLTVSFAYTYWEIVSTATPSQAVSPYKNSPFGLAAAIQIGALVLNAGKALQSKNPYAILSAVGAATSVIPSLGGTKTLSSIINNQGRGALDTKLDAGASKLNFDKQTIGGISNKSNLFDF